MAILRFVAVLLAALSLGPSLAHVLEAPPRLMVWPAELWRETTVFNEQYRWFGTFGGVLDVGAALATILLAMLARHERVFWLQAIGAAGYTLALIAWISVVAPANAVLATWTPGPLPANFTTVRNRWEIGHMMVASLKLIGLIAIISSLLPRERS